MKEMSYATAAILSVIVVILLLVFYQTVQKTAEYSIADIGCKESVKLNALARYDSTSADIAIKCPLEYISVSSTKQIVVFETTAQALANTWNEFHEGRIQVFNTEEQNFCVIRRVIEFEEAEQYPGFLTYLVQHNPPSVQKSYFSYLTNIEVTEGNRLLQNNLALKNVDVLDTSLPYAAVFLMSKSENIGKVEGSGIGAGIGTGIGVVISGAVAYVSAGTLSWTSIGIISFTTTAGSAASGAISGSILGSNYAANWNAGMALVPYTNESLKNLNCTTLPVAIASNLAHS